MSFYEGCVQVTFAVSAALIEQVKATQFELNGEHTLYKPLSPYRGMCRERVVSITDRAKLALCWYGQMVSDNAKAAVAEQARWERECLEAYRQSPPGPRPQSSPFCRGCTGVCQYRGCVKCPCDKVGPTKRVTVFLVPGDLELAYRRATAGDMFFSEFARRCLVAFVRGAPHE